MSKTFKLFSRLSNALNKDIFSADFGNYLFGINDDYKDLMLDSLGQFNVSYGGWYMLKENEKQIEPTLTEYLEFAITKDQDDIIIYLDNIRNSETRIFDKIVNNTIQDINYLLKSIDQFKWLRHDDLIVTRLNNFRKELKIRYLSADDQTEIGFKPLVWKGDASTLGNIFFDLMKGNTNVKGKILITTDDSEVADFICKAFVNENNEPFERSSIERYLRGKTANRTKVELKINKN